MAALKVWHCRVPSHLVDEGPPAKWSTDSRDNFIGVEVWASCRKHAAIVGASYIPDADPCEVVVRRTRLSINPELYAAPEHARKVDVKADYVGWQ